MKNIMICCLFNCLLVIGISAMEQGRKRLPDERTEEEKLREQYEGLENEIKALSAMSGKIVVGIKEFKAQLPTQGLTKVSPQQIFVFGQEKPIMEATDFGK